MFRRIVLVVAVLIGAFSLPSGAQSQPDAPGGRIRVGTRIIPPFVMRDDKGELTGFSVDLWRAVARQMGVASEFTVVDSVGDILADVASGKSDLGVAAISITAEREKSFDFSQPMADGGLQIAISASAGREVGPVSQFMAFFGSWNFVEILGGVLLLMLLPAPFIWLIERNTGEELLTAKTRLGQFGQAMWWSVCALGGQAQDMPSRLVGRIIAVPWLLFAVLFSSYFTAAVTTRMTVQQLEKTIAGPEDLDGRTISTVAGTIGEEWLKKKQLKILAAPTIEAAIQSVVDAKADAVVFDQPVLSYLVARGLKGRIRMVGPAFDQRHYGIVFKPNAPQRRAVDVALLQLKESGEYRKIEQKYFVVVPE